MHIISKKCILYLWAGPCDEFPCPTLPLTMCDKVEYSTVWQSVPHFVRSAQTRYEACLYSTVLYSTALYSATLSHDIYC